MRIAKIDNAKGLLITLVVFGHMVERFYGWNSSDGGPILYWIYSFHMPLFIILSGLTFNGNNVFDKILFILSVLFIFHLAYAVPYVIKNGGLIYNAFTPYGVLWFLASLASWFLLYKVIGGCKYSVFIAIAISLCAGAFTLPGNYLSYMRTLVFLPFFFVGVQLRDFDFLKVSKFNYISAILFFTISVLFTFLLLHFDVSNRLLFGSYGYLGIGYDFNEGVVYRLLMFASSLIISSLLFIAIPIKDTFLAKLGFSSLSIYVLHWGALWVMENPFRHTTLRCVGGWVYF